MTRSLTTKAGRRQHRGHVNALVVESVRDRWLRKHREWFEKFGIVDKASQRRLLKLWLDHGFMDNAPFEPVTGDMYFKPKAQVTIGVDTSKGWSEDDPRNQRFEIAVEDWEIRKGARS